MKTTTYTLIFTLLFALSPLQAMEQEITVTVESLVPEGGVYFTPVWLGFHNGSFDLFNPRIPEQVRSIQAALAGQKIVLTVVWFQFAAASVIAVVLLSGAINEENSRQTLGVSSRREE